MARWALLAYVVIAGMIEYAFVHNQASGAPLLVLSLMLVMFALDVPLSIGFTVARFQEPSQPTAADRTAAPFVYRDGSHKLHPPSCGAVGGVSSGRSLPSWRLGPPGAAKDGAEAPP